MDADTARPAKQLADQQRDQANRRDEQPCDQGERRDNAGEDDPRETHGLKTRLPRKSCTPAPKRKA
jgi:hypothetical protein